MKLDSIQISQFRNLTNVTLSPSPELNLVYGDNGSGKSSILEAIHFLGFGRSFRTSKPKHVIQEGNTEFNVFAKCSYSDSNTSESERKLGISRNVKEEFTCSIDGERSHRISDLVALLPVQIFTPQSIDQMIGSPSSRRKYLDWGLFHVEHSYGELSRSYQRLLKQRNALLKKYSKESRRSVEAANELKAQIQYWDKQFIALGEQINSKRIAYLDSLKIVFSQVADQFLPEFCFEITYYSGWDKSQSLESQLTNKFEQDLKFGHSTSGPHKADFRIKNQDGVPAFEVLSRGQLRMLVAALQLSQTKTLSSQTSNSGVFLLDDIGAELDENHRQIFIRHLLQTNTQIFVTAIEKEQFSLPTEVYNKKLFHVKHGHVVEE